MKLILLALRAFAVCALYLVLAISFSAWLLSQCHDLIDFALALAFLPFVLAYPWAFAPLHCLSAFWDALYPNPTP